ncbi:spermine/spermidine synthase domain-containing protein [Lyngbya confervoides]|uniref:Polyamine aminopropyltransferase n=1 Tax=Lyngbya confervoides BDU141951 TaxID=1574623 RepID=A0ABD4T228_9CYAN|nr:methyltransferase domain-containing protein [Lyngbya confervoides]MCM1982553.1 spermidine synthase [Lyngbya confervoides BDU141951]
MPGANLEADLWLNEVLTPYDIYSHGASAILAYRKTPYQELYIIESGSYGKGLMLDGKWQSSTKDEFIYHEGIVHPALILHQRPQKVLILGGAEGASIREVLRWKSIERVVMVDIDGEVVQACRELLPEMHQNAFDDPRVELIIDDAQNFIATTQEKWDAVISDLTDPIEQGPAYPLFTQEHYQQIQKILSPRGLLTVQSGSIIPSDLPIHARLAKTLQSVFPYTRSCMGQAPSYGLQLSYILASNTEFPYYPNPSETNRILAEQTTGGLRYLDGDSLLGLMQTPKHVRDAIAQESEIYTLAAPPKFPGRGNVQEAP